MQYCWESLDPVMQSPKTLTWPQNVPDPNPIGLHGRSVLYFQRCTVGMIIDIPFTCTKSNLGILEL